MSNIHVDLDDRSYDIVIESGLLRHVGDYLKKVLTGKRLAIISDTTVFELHGVPLLQTLKESGFNCTQHIFEPGEQSKTTEVVTELCRQLVNDQLDRNSAVIAFGGGVVGDVGGFAAAIYLRGIHYVQIPTTLLSVCDSSVGGKVGVNLDGIKNLVGSFYQPKAVFIDPEVLKTLSQRQIVAGLAEVVKTGLISDPKLYHTIYSNLDEIISLSDLDLVADIIRKSVLVKADVVSQDEKESGIRRILNFGHTIGHALEGALGAGTIIHGEAVLLGMRAALRVSHQKKVLSDDDYVRVDTDLKHLIGGIDLKGLDFDTIREYIKKDKKNVDAKLRFVLLESIGNTQISTEISESDMEDAFTYIKHN